MIKLIPDLIFIVALLISIVALGRGLVLPFSYEDDEWKFITAASIGLLNTILVFLFAIASMYVVFASKVHILPARFVEYEWQIYFLILSLATYFVSIKVEKATMNYCIKTAFIAAKK